MSLPDYIPNIHPIIIHFPIVLIPLGFIVHLVCHLLKQMDEHIIPIGILYLAATASAAAAFCSGRQAADTVSVPPQANLVLTEHADLALWTLCISATATILYWLWIKYRNFSKVPLLVLTIALINIGLMIATADHGGQLVYKFGIGVSTSIIKPNEKPVKVNTGIIVRNDGSWLWDTKQNESNQVFTLFQFIEGKSEYLIKNVKEVGLFSINKPVTFIRDEAVENVQIDVSLNLSEFEGTVSILHHFHSLNQYDYLKISNTEMILGRLLDGKKEVMDTKTVLSNKWNSYQVVGSGRHFKGYLNDNLIVHGHASALDAGSVGLRMNGIGVLGIGRIETTPIINK